MPIPKISPKPVRAESADLPLLPAVVRGLSLTARGLAACAFLLAASVLFGYATHQPHLVKFGPSLAGMSLATAFCMLLISTASLLERPRLRTSALILSIIVLAIAAAEMFGTLLLGQDMLSPRLAAWLLPAYPAFRWPMSPATATTLLCISASMSLRALNRPAAASAGANTGAIISGFVLICYGYNVEDLYRIRFFHTMALNTAAGLFALSAACLLIRPAASWMRIVASAGAGGRQVRGQLAFTALLPLLGWLYLQATRSHWLGYGAAMAIFIIAMMIPLLVLILHDGHLQNRLDFKRRERLDFQARELNAQAAESALRERMELILSNAGIIGVWDWDYYADRVEIDARGARLFGLDPQALASLTMARLSAAVDLDDQGRLHARMTFAIEDGEPFETQFKISNTLHGERFLLLRGQRLLNPNATSPHLAGIVIDMTTQKRIELQLHAANDAAEKANDALQKLALLDALTGLPNRRQFDAVFDVEFHRAVREGKPLSLIMADLDHFKSFNDRYGHPAGDDCLRKVAASMAAVPQRPADMAARYGGEELVLVLPDTDLQGAELIAGWLTSQVRSLRIRHEDNPAGIVTISCGVSSFSPKREAITPAQLLERADKALYAAKQSGRNGVSLYVVSRAEMARQPFLLLDTPAPPDV